MATMTCLCTIFPLLLVIGWLLYNVKLLEATTAGTHGHDDLQLHIRSDASRHLRNLRRKGKCATNQVHRLSASANFFLQCHLVTNFFVVQCHLVANFFLQCHLVLCGGGEIYSGGYLVSKFELQVS